MTNENTCRFALTKPSIGFTNLLVGTTRLKGVSYINPYLLFDLKWFLRKAVLGHATTIDIDCESYGMAHLTITPSQDLIIVNGEDEAEVILGIDPADMAKELADSIEMHEHEWALWKYEEDMSEDECLDEVRRIVADLRTYTNLANGKIIDVPALAQAFLDIKPNQLKKADIERLYAEILDMIEIAKHTGAQKGWIPTEPVIELGEDDYVRCAILKVDGPYFEKRQLAFLRSDGTIELAGWADSKNSRPLQWAFAHWAEATSNRRH